MIKINNNIPGWNTPVILKILGTYAAAVPENGYILELGALFGRSTYVLGVNKKDSVILTSIDSWLTFNYDIRLAHDNLCGEEERSLLKSKLEASPDILKGDDFYELWKTFTSNIVNNNSIRAFTSIPNINFPMVDFIYHDAGHSYDDVYFDLNHWFPKLKNEGILIIDDYHDNFSGLCDAVNKFVSEQNLYTEMVTDRNMLIRRK